VVQSAKTSPIKSKIRPKLSRPNLSWLEAKQSDAPAWANKSRPIIPSKVDKSEDKSEECCFHVEQRNKVFLFDCSWPMDRTQAESRVNRTDDTQALKRSDVIIGRSGIERHRSSPKKFRASESLPASFSICATAPLVVSAYEFCPWPASWVTWLTLCCLFLSLVRYGRYSAIWLADASGGLGWPSKPRQRRVHFHWFWSTGAILLLGISLAELALLLVLPTKMWVLWPTCLRFRLLGWLGSLLGTCLVFLFLYAPREAGSKRT